MYVKNRSCIRRLSFRSLRASKKRNFIAVLAIALTTLLFTSLFTVALSINRSYETYQFRQLGGYSHGTFKEVSEEQLAAISAHPKVRETGVRIVIGVLDEGVFSKQPAEISYMDENCTKWSYAAPTVGRMPEHENEISMDTKALELLGVEPKLGAQITLTFPLHNEAQSGPEVTDTFTLAGWWEYDDLMPVHYINVSNEYVNKMEGQGKASFRVDLDVMMGSCLDIRGQMEQVDRELGYSWEDRGGDNTVRIGVNWGYTASQLARGLHMDLGSFAAIAAVLVLVIFTGHLIIYNIFQISVTGDIRFYGLLKTIGVDNGIRVFLVQRIERLGIEHFPFLRSDFSWVI